MTYFFTIFLAFRVGRLYVRGKLLSQMAVFICVYYVLTFLAFLIIGYIVTQTTVLNEKMWLHQEQNITALPELKNYKIHCGLGANPFVN